MKVFGQLEGAQIESLGADPTGTGLVEGRVWYRSDLDRFKGVSNGVVVEFADLTSAQTFQAKTFQGVIFSDYAEFDQQGSTPSTPAAGKHRVYFKNDGTLYTLDENGNEIPVGSGGSGSGKNYFDPVDAEIDSTIGNWLTDDGVGGASGGSHTAPPGLSLSVTAVAGELLAGINSLEIAKDAADRSGHFVKVSTDTIDPSDRGQPLMGSFSFRALSGYVSDDLIVELYDLTNAEVMYAGQAADLVLPNSKGRMNFTVFTKDNTEQIQFRLKVNNTNANAFSVVVDEFRIGPMGQVIVNDGKYVGEISWSGSSTVPKNHLYCNGQAVSRTEYAELFAAIGTAYGVGDGSTTFNVPEMRGEFPRGWDDGRGADSGRSLGSSQGDSTALPNSAFSLSGSTSPVGDHTHLQQGSDLSNFRMADNDITDAVIAGYSTNFTSAPALSSDFPYSAGTFNIPTLGDGGHSHSLSGSVAGGDAETRPRNVSGAFYICYKSESNVINTNQLDLEVGITKAGLSGAQTVTATTGFVLVEFDTINNDQTTFDTLGAFNVATYKYVVREAGYYDVEAQITPNGLAANTEFVAAIYIDNVEAIQRVSTSPDFNADAHISDSYYLTAGQEIDIRIASPDDGDYSIQPVGSYFIVKKRNNLRMYNVVRNDEIISTSFTDFAGVGNLSYENVPTNFLTIPKGRWRLKANTRYRNTDTVQALTSLLWEVSLADQANSPITGSADIEIITGYITQIVAGFNHGSASRFTPEYDAAAHEIIMDVKDDVTIYLNVYSNGSTTARYSADFWAERIR